MEKWLKSERNRRKKMRWVMGGWVGVCMMGFCGVIMLGSSYRDRMLDLMEDFGSKAFILGAKPQNTTLLHPPNSVNDKLLGEQGLEEQSCLSRYQSHLYHKTSRNKPSLYLLSKLRNYENLHRRCGPHTNSYNATLKLLHFPNISTSIDCNYIIWIAKAGLGNRILSMASAFLYALLTDRVLLVEHRTDMVDLFCEPFPDTSWLLPEDFPLKNEFGRFNQQYPDTYGNMLKNKRVNTSMEFPPLILFHYLVYNYDARDKLFYCEQDQVFFQKVPWLIIRSDEYFVPALLLIPSFEQELIQMFPDKETVFHHLARYLFHPSNKAWGLITRFYHSYLEAADERIGIQIRVFKPEATPFEAVMDQILTCTIKEMSLLPEVGAENANILASPWRRNQTSKAVLIASLHPEYYDHMKNKYWESPTLNGERIGVYQASHEGKQQFGDNTHNMKAWVEMNLLSLSDMLVTSSWSTFGYVAQGLGGLKPWILYRPENRNSTDPACSRAMSMEPCFHVPPSYDCKTKRNVDTGTIVPYVRHCEDVTSGLKLVNE